MAFFPKTEIQKATSPVFITRLGQETASTDIAVAVTAGDTVINVTDATGMVVGNSFFIIDDINNIIEQFIILSIATNAITVDTPSGNDFITTTFAGSSNTNFNVDGSSTPVKFNLKTGLESVDIDLKISRIIIVIETSTTGSISDFGNISALTNGIYLRRSDTVSTTYWNVKTNLELTALAYDLEGFPSGVSGNEGIRFRLTFPRIGAYINLAQNEDLELWVQDALGALVNAFCTVEGVIE